MSETLEETARELADKYLDESAGNKRARRDILLALRKVEKLTLERAAEVVVEAAVGDGLGINIEQAVKIGDRDLAIAKAIRNLEPTP